MRVGTCWNCWRTLIYNTILYRCAVNSPQVGMFTYLPAGALQMSATDGFPTWQLQCSPLWALGRTALVGAFDISETNQKIGRPSTSVHSERRLEVGCKWSSLQGHLGNNPLACDVFVSPGSCGFKDRFLRKGEASRLEKQSTHTHTFTSFTIRQIGTSLLSLSL